MNSDKHADRARYFEVDLEKRKGIIYAMRNEVLSSYWRHPLNLTCSWRAAEWLYFYNLSGVSEEMTIRSFCLLIYSEGEGETPPCLR